MFSNKIKEIRKLRKMTQQQLADAVGISFTVISKYESGKTTPPADRLEAIANALGVSVDTIISPDSISNMSYAARRRTTMTSVDDDRYYITSSQLAENVVRNARGVCELCHQPGPFNEYDGQTFLESHFITWLSKGGQNDPQNIVALCPNCHKRIHVLNDPRDIEKMKKAAAKHIGEEYWKSMQTSL